MFTYHDLAPVNSILNGCAGILLLAGYIAIRKHRIRAHRAFMLAAFAMSTLFFISYATYHYKVGDVYFQGHGAVRPVYFTILISHIILATAIVPLALITLWRALKNRFQSHRRIAVWTWPIWIYVSVTGVIVYIMCYQLYPPGYKKSAVASVPTHVEERIKHQKETPVVWSVPGAKAVVRLKSEPNKK